MIIHLRIDWLAASKILVNFIMMLVKKLTYHVCTYKIKLLMHLLAISEVSIASFRKYFTLIL